MTNAGWYPDPAGTPDTYRYWDGQAWSQMTTTNPGGQAAAPQAQPTPPAPPAAPTPPAYGQLPPTPAPGIGAPGGGAGQPPYGFGTPTPGAGGGGGNGKVIGIVIAAVLALLIIGVGGFFGIRALSGEDDTKADGKRSDDSSQSDETDPTDDSSESSDATDETSAATDQPTSTFSPTGVMCTGGRADLIKDPKKKRTMINRGGLTAPLKPGYEVSKYWSDNFPFGDRVMGSSYSISARWAANQVIGGLIKANGFTSPEQSAEIMMQCMINSGDIWGGFESRNDVSNAATTIDGHKAWLLETEIKIDADAAAETKVQGDHVALLVVDTGKPGSFGFYLDMVPIGDTERIADQKATVRKVKVE